jgi:hypothetical protein
MRDVTEWMHCMLFSKVNAYLAAFGVGVVNVINFSSICIYGCAALDGLTMRHAANADSSENPAMTMKA